MPLFRTSANMTKPTMETVSQKKRKQSVKTAVQGVRADLDKARKTFDKILEKASFGGKKVDRKKDLDYLLINFYGDKLPQFLNRRFDRGDGNE